ncbi:antibiotic biosynthesis monooxygenase family protein [Ectobacillus ponti]|uniref:Antibiotic biosynthesis monooxygenase n=1 Tax=Ectobacillus ponti TaxID=2961894 RepID=A0AA42BPA6_9BACI|nr:antibiotic biosynthesis monooxygenase [Ectobacillus ponti]MCP8968216.1 antibiotic biosynthesis monooxygenase [Ectobacillus ponti]
MTVSITYLETGTAPEAAAFTGTGEKGTIVLHESDAGEMKYEVLDAVGELTGAKGFAVLNNIPVKEEGREQFEQRFLNRARLIENEPGFQVFRLLRPLTDDTYVVLTIWDDEASFKAWQQSQSYNKAHQKRHTPEGIDQQVSIFPRPSFVTTFAL